MFLKRSTASLLVSLWQAMQSPVHPSTPLPKPNAGAVNIRQHSTTNSPLILPPLPLIAINTLLLYTKRIHFTRVSACRRRQTDTAMGRLPRSRRPPEPAARPDDRTGRLRG